VNGPEHYREAERIAAMADNAPEYSAWQQLTLFAAAQVHATLALAAATAAGREAFTVADVDTGRAETSLRAADDWAEVIS